ncbi:MAG: haloacid dehalogenase-like hydrolase [Chthoniobacterales bacterium]
MSQRLLLWDIDSTLLTTAGAGEIALRQIVSRRYGAEDDLRDIEIAGCTDIAIARSILQKYEVELTPENVRGFLNEYLERLGQNLPQPNGRVLPGVVEILERLHGRDDRVLALLTGNLRRGAQLKLECYGLWKYFEFGAFADDHHDRNELGAFARRRAQERHGHDFEASAIDVIGDTGHDIACGRIFGARTIAVATGSWTRAQLAEHHPDLLFDDLGSVDQVIATLGW